MTYAIACFAIAFVMVLVNALLMQEQEQAAVVDNIRYHIDIAPFDEWCETHAPAGYWDRNLVAYKVAGSIITGHGIPRPAYAYDNWDGYPEHMTLAAEDYISAKVCGSDNWDAIDAIEEGGGNAWRELVEPIMLDLEFQMYARYKDVYNRDRQLHDEAFWAKIRFIDAVNLIFGVIVEAPF